MTRSVDRGEGKGVRPPAGGGRGEGGHSREGREGHGSGLPDEDEATIGAAAAADIRLLLGAKGSEERAATAAVAASAASLSRAPPSIEKAVPLAVVPGVDADNEKRSDNDDDNGGVGDLEKDFEKRGCGGRVVPSPARPSTSRRHDGSGAAPPPPYSSIFPADADEDAQSDKFDDEEEEDEMLAADSTFIRPTRGAAARPLPFTSVFVPTRRRPPSRPGAWQMGGRSRRATRAAAPEPALPDEDMCEMAASEHDGEDEEVVVTPALSDAVLVDEAGVIDASMVVAMPDDENDNDGNVPDDNDNDRSDARDKGWFQKRLTWRPLLGLAIIAALVTGATMVVGALAAKGRFSSGDGENAVTGVPVGSGAADVPDRHEEGWCPPLLSYCSKDNDDGADQAAGRSKASFLVDEDRAAPMSIRSNEKCLEQIACDMPFDGGRQLSDFRLSLSYDGRVLVASYLDGLNSLRSGKARAYRILPASDARVDEGGSPVPAEVTPLGQTFLGSSSDYLVAVVSGNGRRLATVAVKYDSDPQGLVVVYEYNKESDEWIQLGEPITGETANDGIKWGLALNYVGSVVALGARTAGSTGRARAYRYVEDEEEGGRWVKMGTDVMGEGPDEDFGRSVSLSRDGLIMAVGAWHNGGAGYHAGHVRVYRFNQSRNSEGEGTGEGGAFEDKSGEWIQMGQDIDGMNPGDQFGLMTSLSSDGMTVAASARGSDGTDSGVDGSSSSMADSGSVRAFRYDPDEDEWVQIGGTIHGDGPYDGVRGVSLSEDGRRMAYGGGQEWGEGYVRVLEYVEGAGADAAGEWRGAGGTVRIMSNEGAEKFSGVSVALAWPTTAGAVGDVGVDGAAAVLAVSGRDEVDEGACRPECPSTGVVRLFAAKMGS